MGELIHEYVDPVHDPDGLWYVARAMGALREDGLWEAWLEFFPADGGEPIETERETEQSSLEDLVYWASGIERVYLEGALVRARRRAETTTTLR
jgi:hypothetical protein